MRPIKLEELRESAVLLAKAPPRFARGTLYASLLLLSVLLAWSYLVHVPVMVVADGRVRPSGRLWRIDSEVGGSVIEVKVEEHQRVNRGDVLIRLDPTVIQLEIQAVEREIARLVPERRELERMAVALSRPATESRLEGLERWKERYAAWMKENDLAKINLQRRQEEMKRLENLETVVSEAERTTARLVLAEAETSLAVAHARQRAEVERALEETLRRLDGMESQKAKKKEEGARHEVRSPLSGTVTFNAVRHTGEVVKAGQLLFVVAPEGTRFVAEVWVPGHQAGFLSQGMAARVEVPTFPQATFGWINGTVSTVAPDVMQTSSEAGIPAGGAAPLYRVEVALDRDRLTARDGRVGQLKLGLVTRARLVVREERLLFHVAGILAEAFNWGP